MINKLYGILTNGAKATGTYAWYNKRCDNPMHTQRMDTIRSIILTGIHDTYGWTGQDYKLWTKTENPVRGVDAAYTEPTCQDVNAVKLESVLPGSICTENDCFDRDTTADYDRTIFFACTVCGLVSNSAFDAEIKALDPDNTYGQPSRPPDATHSNSSYCFYTLVQPLSTYRLLKGYLDPDLVARLAGGSWLDYVAAGCVQMLREADL